MKRVGFVLLLLAALATPAIFLMRPSAQASTGATITVNSPADSNARDSVVTLREAMLLATGGLALGDLHSGECAQVSHSRYGPPCSTTDSIGTTSADTVTFDNSVFPSLTPATIILGSTLPGLSTGNDTVDGAAAGVIVNGSTWAFPCFEITSNSNTIKGLEIYNCSSGISIHGGAHGNVIGGATPAERNVIGSEVQIYDAGTSGNVVKGNYIGTDASGTVDLPLEYAWVSIWNGASSNVIGGSSPAERNVMAEGVYLADGASGNVVKGNYIGVDASGSVAFTGYLRVEITEGAHDNMVGGSAPGEGNVIGGGWGDDGFGLIIDGSGTTGNIVRGNHIGTDATGAIALPNWTGIYVSTDAASNIVGGTGSGDGNVVAFNYGDGVLVDGAYGNPVRANSIHSNGGKGIENLNGNILPPIIDTVSASVSGHTNPKCYPCTVEVFSDDEDEGRIYHGSATTHDDATGTWTYLGAVTGPNITATITDASGNTSEFSKYTVVESDSDGDGCTNGQEWAMGFNPFARYDFYDVPVPARADPTPNGVRNQAVTLKDVLAVLKYVGTYAGDGGSPNGNGVAYDSDKGFDTNGDTVADIPPDGVHDGQDYDRSPGVPPNPPWEAGPPNGAVSMKDVLTALAQVGLDCSEPP